MSTTLFIHKDMKDKVIFKSQKCTERIERGEKTWSVHSDRMSNIIKYIVALIFY